jgi:hypothetical protein
MSPAKLGTLGVAIGLGVATAIWFGGAFSVATTSDVLTTVRGHHWLDVMRERGWQPTKEQLHQPHGD